MSTADFMDLMGDFWVQRGVSSHVTLGTRYQTMLKILRILEYLGIVACAVRKLKFAAEPIPIPSVQQTYQVSSGRKEYSVFRRLGREVQRVTKSGLSENRLPENPMISLL